MCWACPLGVPELVVLDSVPQELLFPELLANQTESDYFAPYDSHLSTDEFYTSDYDLSKFNASQYGFGISYTDIFAKTHIWKYGLKTIDFKYNNYQRNTGLSANYVGIGFKFVQD